MKELKIRSFSLPDSSCSSGSNMDAGEDQEFYERIEAPKFVDFTVPDHHCPDDRYWFCQRVGCEQKHEEEMDSEKIYKDFVLRVMAARSPNVRLQKALSRNASRNMKCPMSVPSKSLKPRVSRLAVASSISRKLGYEIEKAKPPTNPTSTPKIKTKQVAAKYLTTPRSKKCLPDANSFRSVQNPKPTTVAVPKNRSVAKAIVFHSPKKAISLKKSVELRTPLTKLCEGMTKLEITSKKKDNRGKSVPPAIKNKTSKNHKVPSLSQPQVAKKVKGKKESNSIEIVENEPCSMEIGADSDKQKLTAAGECSGAEAPLVEANPPSKPLSTADLNSESSDGPSEELNLSNLEQMGSKRNEDSSTEGSEQDTKENSENVENFKSHSTEDQLSEVQYQEDESTESDDKENAVSADENRTINHNNIQTKILGEQKNTIKKIVQPVDKNLKAQVSTPVSSAPSGLKFKKPKPTNPKPFRLRTDERSILKESNLERKGHNPDPPSGNILRKHGADTQGNVESLEQQNRGSAKESADINCRSLIKGSKTPQRTNKSGGKVVRTKTVTMTPKRPNASTFQAQKPMSSPFGRSERSLRKVGSPMEEKQVMSQRLFSNVMPSQKLAVIDENSSKVSKAIKASENGAKVIHQDTASASLRSTSRGKSRVTIPKEPHFHTTHVPKSCTRKLT